MPRRVFDQVDDAWLQEKPLFERLKITDDVNFQPIPVSLLRKYISYARRFVFPKYVYY